MQKNFIIDASSIDSDFLWQGAILVANHKPFPIFPSWDDLNYFVNNFHTQIHFEEELVRSGRVYYCYSPILAYFLTSAKFQIKTFEGEFKTEKGILSTPSFIKGFKKSQILVEKEYQVSVDVKYSSIHFINDLKQNFEKWYMHAVDYSFLAYNEKENTNAIEVAGYYNGLVWQVLNMHQIRPSLFNWIRDTKSNFWNSILSKINLSMKEQVELAAVAPYLFSIKQTIDLTESDFYEITLQDKNAGNSTSQHSNNKEKKDDPFDPTWESICQGQPDVVISYLRNAGIIDDNNKCNVDKHVFALTWAVLEEMKVVELITTVTILHKILEKHIFNIGTRVNFNDHLRRYRMEYGNTTPEGKAKEKMRKRLIDSQQLK